MNDQARTIGPDDLRESTCSDNDAMTQTTIALVNAVLRSVQPFCQHQFAPQNDALAISAMAVAAGAIHGELVGMGLQADMSDEAVHKLLAVNFRTGQKMGQDKIERRLAELAAAELAASGQVPS